MLKIVSLINFINKSLSNISSPKEQQQYIYIYNDSIVGWILGEKEFTGSFNLIMTILYCIFPLLFTE